MANTNAPFIPLSSGPWRLAILGATLVGALVGAGQGQRAPAFASPAPVGEGWQVEVVTEDGYPYAGSGLTIGLDGTLHLAYVAYESRDLMYAWKVEGEEWRTDLVDDSEPWAGYPGTVISPLGEVHITYCRCPALLPSGEWTAEASLMHAWGGPRAWQREAVDFGGVTGQYATPLFATDGTLHIAFATTGDLSLKHAWGKPGEEMSVETVEAGEDGGSYATPLRTSDGQLHILYMRRPMAASWGPGQLWHAWKSEGIWNQQRVDLPTPVASWLAAVVAEDDTIHVAYGEYESEALWHAWGGQEGWEAEVVAPDAAAWYKSMAVGSDEVFHIAFWDSDIGALFHSWGTQGSWQTELVEGGEEHNLGSFPSIALAPDGTIHITYADYNHGQVRHAQRAP